MSIRKRTDGEYSAHLQGTLDLLILRTLIFGRQHGQGIARAIQTQSDNVLIVEHGSLYPALQRLEERGFIDADWGTSENNRKARFYTLTRTGRKELAREQGAWRRVAVGDHARARARVGDGLTSASSFRLPASSFRLEAGGWKLEAGELLARGGVDLPNPPSEHVVIRRHHGKH